MWNIYAMDVRTRTSFDASARLAAARKPATEPDKPVTAPLDNPRYRREREAAEAAWIEATKRVEDFIDHICGPGSDKPSGPGKPGWMN